MTAKTFAGLIALSLLLAGCGNKGPLVLPPAPVAEDAPLEAADAGDTTAPASDDAGSATDAGTNADTGTDADAGTDATTDAAGDDDADGDTDSGADVPPPPRG